MGKIPHTSEDHECLLSNSCFLGEGQCFPLEKGATFFNSPLEKGVRGL
jgi:hypothetical protein